MASTTDLPARLTGSNIVAEGSEAAARTEAWFRRGLLVVSVLSTLALLISAGVMIWAENEFSPAESVISAQSQMLARNGTLYYGLTDYPYTVCAYMPLFYWAEAGMIKLGMPAFLGGRLITFAALLGLIGICWKTTLLYTEHRLAAWIAAILVASSPLMVFWGVVAQTDVVAVCFAMTAFYLYSRNQVKREPTLLLAGIFAGLALFTKQTMVAVPSAIVLALWLRGDRKQAWKFAVAFGGAIGALVLGLDALLQGRFLINTLFANVNPLNAGKLLAQLQYFGGVSAGMGVIVAAAFGKLVRGRGTPVLIYLGCVALVFLATAPKQGSDTNYQLELTAILAVATAVGLQKLDFFDKYFRGSKSWITLLLLPLGVHVMVGYRVAANMMVARVATEQALRSQIEDLKPFLANSDASKNRVLSNDYNSMARLRGSMEVEPLIYGWLVNWGRIDGEPVRRDLEQGAFGTVILNTDVFAPDQNQNAELTSLPANQLAEIRNHYRLVAHVPGPYLDGVFVYQPEH